MKYFVLNGPTASGKSILMDYLLSENSDFLEPIRSFTTRPVRPGEQDGDKYYFITSQQYVEMLRNGLVAEQIKYLDCYYGVSVQELQRVAATGKNGMAIMTLEGVRQLKQNVGYHKVISIFLYRDLSAIAQAIGRSPLSEPEKAQRIELARREMRDISTCDHVVYNTSSLAEAARQLLDIIKREINSHPLEMEILPGQRYRHYQGGIYEIVTELAEHTETASPMVVYRDVETGTLYARPYEIFCGRKVWPPVHGKLIDRYERVEE